MNKICGYSCEHNKGGVCQITMCDKQIYITTKTNEPLQKQIKSKENATIIRALNNYGRVPEQHELLDEIKRLEQELQRKDNIINELGKWLSDVCLDPHCCYEYRIVLDKLKELKENK